MLEAGFKQGTAPPCSFHHEARSIRTYIHGDDYVSVGKDQDLQWLKKELEQTYGLKTQALGPETQDLKQVRVLNRIITLKNEGIQYEADPRHVEILLRELGLEEQRQYAHQGPTKIG